MDLTDPGLVVAQHQQWSNNGSITDGEAGNAPDIVVATLVTQLLKLRRSRRNMEGMIDPGGSHSGTKQHPASPSSLMYDPKSL